MDREDNVLESILGEVHDVEDVEMLDVEEGELVDQNVSNGAGQTNAEGDKVSKQETENKNRSKRGNKKKKNRKKRNGSVANIDINRFVIETCRKLKEKKSYMVYTAVGCLGVSALSDLINEVEAVQACGGQMTADGKRQRNGGGILWAILKTREPNTYREIMKRAKEFEKQFKLQNKGTAVPPQQPKTAAAPHDREVPSENQSLTQSHVETKRKPIMDRIRVPVSYEDIVDDVDHDAKENGI